MTDSRTKNTSRNILSGLLNRFATIILTFVNRTVIIYALGTAFSGLGSLFTSILGILNIAELGFNVAITQSMYEPIAKNDKRRICELLTLYRKIYYIIGSIIFLSGITLIPFLHIFIKGDIPQEINLYALYLLYLINTVISYFLFAYRESLLLAHQRKDISDYVRTILLVAKQIIQLIVLCLTKNYYIYLGIELISTIITNLWISKESQNRYPEYYCLSNTKVRMSDDIKKQVKGLFVGKLCDRARNTLDNIIISSFLGLTAVAIYDNYYYVYSALYWTMLVVCNGMSASIGNSIVTESVERNYGILNRLSFIVAWISGWMSICMLCLYQPFMELWMGKQLMLPNSDMMLFCLYFYAINMNHIKNQYVNGTGIWWEIRKSNVAEAIANLVLNVVLGKMFGITGIVLATIITIVIFNFAWRTKVLFNTYFRNMSYIKYLINHGKWFVTVLLAAIITYLLCDFIAVNNLILKMIINAVVCIIIPNLILIIVYLKNEQFESSKNLIVKFISTIMKREK